MTSDKESPIDAELRRLRANPAAWVGAAFSFSALRDLETEYAAIAANQRTPETVRRFATAALNEMLLLLVGLYQGPFGTGAPSFLLHLSSALEDLSEGLNSRLLVTGDLAEQLPKGRHSAGWHQRTRARSAAIVAFLLANRIEPTQMKAAGRVAESLNRGGYSPQGEAKLGRRISADTVKRWHTSARRGDHGLSEPFDRELRSLNESPITESDPVLMAERALAWLESTCNTYGLGKD